MIHHVGWRGGRLRPKQLRRGRAYLDPGPICSLADAVWITVKLACTENRATKSASNKTSTIWRGGEL